MRPRIAICTPIYKSSHPKYDESVARCCADGRFETSVIQCFGDANLDNARTLVFERFLNQEKHHDWFCMIDSDIEFSPDTIWQLINKPVNVIGAAYCYKSSGPKAGLPVIRILPEETPDDLNLLKVKYLGGGFIFVRSDFLRRMIGVYNDLEFTIHPNDPTEPPNAKSYALWMPMVVDEPRWNHREYLSEDWAFCERIRRMGEPIYLDLCALIGHWDGDQCYRLECK